MNPRSVWESGLGRFEEIGSEDGGFRGGPLPEAMYHKGQHLVHDELFLGSGDAAIDAHFGGPRNDSYDELSYSEAYGDTDEDDVFYHSGMEATSVALRDDDEELLQRALDSIRKAKEQGRAVVDMGVEELTALERSRKQRVFSQPKSSKSRKKLALTGSGTVKSKKQRGSSQSATSSPSAGKVKPVKPSKRGSGSTDDGMRSPHASSFGSGAVPLQIASSSGGVPIHQAVTHYRTSSQSGSRPSSRHSTRSPTYDIEPTTPPIPSSHPRYFSAPGPDTYASYPSYPSQFRSNNAASASALASASNPALVSSPLRDAEDLHFHHSRARSSSSAVAAAAAAATGFPPLYEQDPAVYHGYPGYGGYGFNASARRSGPEITYAALRRVPPSLGIGGNSPGGGRSGDFDRNRTAHGAGVRMSSDPMMTTTTSPMAHRSRDGEGSPRTPSISSDEEGGSGVLVDVVSDGVAGGYDVVQGSSSGGGAASGSAALGSGKGGGGRRRKKRG